MTNRLAALGAMAIVFLIVVAVFAPQIAPQNPDKVHVKDWFAAAFSGKYILGADQLGRDILSRIIYGSRVSLVVALLSVSGATLLGGTAGIVAGYFGGRVDTVLMRIVDVLFAIPTILIALSVVNLLGRSMGNIVFALALGYSPSCARVCYSATIAAREEAYVEGSRALGASAWRILRQDILPNIFPILMVQMTVYFSRAILAEAGLGFLGLGVQPPTPSWGQMLAESREYYTHSLNLAIWPGLAIVVAVFAVNLFGDGLRDVLDPRAWQAGE